MNYLFWVVWTVNNQIRAARIHGGLVLKISLKIKKNKEIMNNDND